MGLKSLTIALPAGRDVFYSGETIQGYVEFEVDDDSNYEYMELTFYGLAFSHWKTKKGSHSASDIFFKISQHLTNGGLSFTRGMYRIPFSYSLAPE